MTVSLALFYLYALAALAGAIGLVTSRKLVHAVMWLLATLVAIAGLFLLLGSDFLAAMQLFVYGGAITVLVLFVLMLTRPSAESVAITRPVNQAVAAGSAVALFAAMAMAFSAGHRATPAGQPIDTASLAEMLFSRYLLPFEIAGLLLTIALIGAVVIAREAPAASQKAGELP